MRPDKTAILVFSRSALAESRSKAIYGKNRIKSIRLYQNLNRKVLQTVKRTELPYLVVSERDQKGTTFVERYKNAFQEAFNKGFDHVICVGNDSLQLTTDHLLELASRLENVSLVYGRTSLGGIFALGLSITSFQRLNWESLPWCSNRLVKDLEKAALSMNMKYWSAPSVLYEFNAIEDVHEFIEEMRNNRRLLSIYSEVFEQLIQVLNWVPLSVRKYARPITVNGVLRGPPLSSIH